MALASKASPLQKLYAGDAQLSPLVSFDEQVSQSLSPAFSGEGYPRQDLSLVKHGKAAEQLRRLERLIQDVLLFTRGESLGRDRIELRSLLDEAAQTIAPLCAERGVRFVPTLEVGDFIMTGSRKALAGACAGFVTAFLQTHLGVPSILAGIITNTGLYTVNLAIMGFSSNVPMLKTETVFTMARALFGEKSPYKLIVAVTVTVVACALLILFLGTRLGLSIRATGDNPDMVRASSINTAFTITVGLCVSNAMTSLSGAVLAQYQKSADINLGTGMVVIGLASLIIGETLFGRGGMWVKAAAAVAGSVIYRFIIALALRANVPSECLKLISAVIVALAISAGDHKAFKAASGVGPKLAQRIVLELKDKVAKGFVDGISLEDVAGAFADTQASQGSSQAIAALVSLGYSQSEAALAVSKIDAALPVEEIIKLALRSMAGRR